MEKNKENKNGQTNGDSGGCWHCGAHGMHGFYGKWSLLRIVIMLVMLYVVFWAGFKLGEIKAFFGYGYYGMMGGSYYGYPQDGQYGPGPGMMRLWGYNAGGQASTTTKPNAY